MQFLIDECISPQVAARLNDTGRHAAVHPRNIGRRGDPDHVVLRNAIAEDRIIVTENTATSAAWSGGKNCTRAF